MNACPRKLPLPRWRWPKVTAVVAIISVLLQSNMMLFAGVAPATESSVAVNAATPIICTVSEQDRTAGGERRLPHNPAREDEHCQACQLASFGFVGAAKFAGEPARYGGSRLLFAGLDDITLTGNTRFTSHRVRAPPAFL